MSILPFQSPFKWKMQVAFFFLIDFRERERGRKGGKVGGERGTEREYGFVVPLTDAFIG